MTTTTTISRSVQARIRKLVESRLGKYGAKATKFATGVDLLGDDIIIITLSYADGSKVIDVNDLSRLVYETRESLFDLNEHRFPQFMHNYHPGQKFETA